MNTSLDFFYYCICIPVQTKLTNGRYLTTFKSKDAKIEFLYFITY